MTIVSSGRQLAQNSVENAASDGFGSNFSRQTSSKDHEVFTSLAETTSLTNLMDMTSLATSERPQNASEHCIIVRKKGPVDKESNNSVTV